MSPVKKILFQLSGSIACYKACHLISRLAQDGHEVQIAATPGALQFVGAATLEGLTGRPVFSDLFEQGKMMGHIDWSKWADVSLLCPASANTLNSLAAGLASTAVGSLFLSHDFSRPYLIAPAMNRQMYAHPATQKSIKTLLEFGARFLEVEEGHQACGDVGPGRMMEPDRIYARLKDWNIL